MQPNVIDLDYADSSIIPHSAATIRARCAACQLQLCKSRQEPPHAALKEVSREGMNQQRVGFNCQTCGAILIRSSDLSAPGWSQQRRAAMAGPEDNLSKTAA